MRLNSRPFTAGGLGYDNKAVRSVFSAGDVSSRDRTANHLDRADKSERESNRLKGERLLKAMTAGSFSIRTVRSGTWNTNGSPCGKSCGHKIPQAKKTTPALFIVPLLLYKNVLFALGMRSSSARGRNVLFVVSM